ncbi:hypothetical protein ACWEN6_23575 [Sphaerisporangium sp. NPDC004334]
MAASPTPQEQQFIHLVRLAWDLRKRGLGAAIELPSRDQPVLLLARTPGPVRVMAVALDGRWFFTWGRGRARRIRALADDAADRVWEVAQ